MADLVAKVTKGRGVAVPASRGSCKVGVAIPGGRGSCRAGMGSYPVAGGRAVQGRGLT